MTELVQNEVHKRFAEVVTQIQSETTHNRDKSYKRSQETLSALFNSLIEDPEKLLRQVLKTGVYKTTIDPSTDESEIDFSGKHFPFEEIELEGVEAYTEFKAAMDAINYPLTDIHFKDIYEEFGGPNTHYRGTNVRMTFKI